MKRTLVVALTAAVFVAPAVASAAGDGFVVYEGAVRGSGADLELKVGATQQPKVRKLAAYEIEVPCEGGTVALLDRVGVKGKARIGNGGGFRLRSDDGETVFKAIGKIRGERASGTLRLSGELEASDGGARDCDTGTLRWSASAKIN